LARRFAAKYAVAINARKTDYLRTLATAIRGNGGEALEVQADIGKADEVRNAFAQIRTLSSANPRFCYSTPPQARGEM
jgi:short-subunit dehydrogenase